eukprot:5815742-Lingulodinium_polyedra.AAC.1
MFGNRLHAHNVAMQRKPYLPVNIQPVRCEGSNVPAHECETQAVCCRAETVWLVYVCTTVEMHWR